MRILAASLLVGLLCTLSSGRAQTWRIGDDQPFRIRIADLPKARQKSILKSLEPSLQERAKEFDLDPQEIAAAEKSLLIREISTKSGKLTLVQGWGLNLCGGTGNCKVWVLGTRDRPLLDGQASRLTILRTMHRGLPSIVTSSSSTADGAQLVRYRFDGVVYRAQTCATERIEYLGKVYAKPRLDYGSCDK